MVGVVESLAHVTRATFRTPEGAGDGDVIVLLGENTDEIGGSEYLARIHGVVAGRPPRVDLDGHRRLIAALLDAIRAGHVCSAHDASDGGLAVALAECCIAGDVRTGADVDLGAWTELPLRALLYGEAHGRVVVSTHRPDAVLALAARHGVPARDIGRVRPASAGFAVTVGAARWSVPVERLAAAYHDAIPALMQRPAAHAS
jgi:phosphoribosylformylglycinamidine synthase